MSVWDYIFPLLESLSKAAQECADGSFEITLSKQDGTVYCAVGDTLENAIKGAVAMIANGADFNPFI